MALFCFGPFGVNLWSHKFLIGLTSAMDTLCMKLWNSVEYNSCNNQVCLINRLVSLELALFFLQFSSHTPGNLFMFYSQT